MNIDKFNQKGEEADLPAQDERIFVEKSPEQRMNETLEVLLRDGESVDLAVELIKENPELSAEYEKAEAIIKETTSDFEMKDGEAVVDKRVALATMVNEIVTDDDLILKTRLKILVKEVKKGGL